MTLTRRSNRTAVSEKSQFTEAEAHDLVLSLVRPIAYCHAKNIAHRDLKPENFLFSDKTDTAELLCADFGFAKLMTSEYDTADGDIGTLMYCAPELLTPETGRRHSKQVE